MKHFIFAAMLAVSLSGCFTLENLAGSFSTAPAAQASTVKAAGEVYVVVAHREAEFLKVPGVTTAAAQKVLAVDANIYSALKAARAADAKGDSAAMGVALQIFNENYQVLLGLIGG